MEDITTCTPQDPEVFRRVWERVMGSKAAPAPAQAEPQTQTQAPPAPAGGCGMDGDLSCAYLRALADAPNTPEPGDSTGSDLEECPGCESSARLRQQTLEALEGWQFYRHLARRTRSGAARVLTALAADAHKQARQLAAAYFLLTGVRYWPTGQLPAPAIPSLWGAVRSRYQAEQQGELACRMAAEETADPALAELYGQLADACRERCRQLRALLEQSAM